MSEDLAPLEASAPFLSVNQPIPSEQNFPCPLHLPYASKGICLSCAEYMLKSNNHQL